MAEVAGFGGPIAAGSSFSPGRDPSVGRSVRDSVFVPAHSQALSGRVRRGASSGAADVSLGHIAIIALIIFPPPPPPPGRKLCVGVAGRSRRGGLGQIVPRDTAQADRLHRGGLGQIVPRDMAQMGRPRRSGLVQMQPRSCSA
ncbi:hypothetical protein C4D60_Mb08t02860 [Musa balbisiana]|uniref:Uncharacterized protein n=1 Tax=Musa balbisiana TaxID=52838 RepID=A0A4S8K0W2_MUSBA|nr:hypothetical protein C4D60_Mb08t02860 [Musa balbisiana]